MAVYGRFHYRKLQPSRRSQPQLLRGNADDQAASPSYLGLLREVVIAGNHRTDVVESAGENHHRDMNQDEQDNRKRGDKMNGACALAASEQVREPMKQGVETRRHRQAGENDHRQQQEDDKEISELLQHIIAPGFVASGESQLDVIGKRFADPAQA